MPSLLDKAKAKAKEAADKKAAEAESEKRFRNSLEKSLESLSKKTMKALKPFHNAPCIGGTLKLLTGEKAWFGGTQYLAIHTLDRGKSFYPTKLLFVKASIESGYTDMSDDVRNVPYTDTYISFRNESKMGGDRDGAGLYFLNEGASTEDGLDKALERVAEHLAPLFDTK